MSHILKVTVAAWKSSCPQGRVPNRRDERVNALATLFRVLETKFKYGRVQLDAPGAKETIISACVPRKYDDMEALAKWKLAVEDDLYTALQIVWPLVFPEFENVGSTSSES